MTVANNLKGVPAPGDRYSLGGCMGRGSYGRVFEAVDSQASFGKVAIKIQNYTKKDSVKFAEQEYKILKDLSANHANLPDFYGVYRRDDDVWFVLELCQGGTAAQLVSGLLESNRKMTEEHMAHILKETVKALLYLHENRVVHRDVKANNILLTKEGEVKLSDFGFSHNFKVLDKTVECLGSPCWMAPEVILSQRHVEGYDNRVDVWSLGITAIELGDGCPPYHSMHPSRTLFQIVTNPPPILSKVFNWSENFLDFVNECLVKNPEHRPYMAEVIEHPFLEQIPENNFHLSLELKCLIDSVGRIDTQKSVVELAVCDKFLKKGCDSNLEPMIIEDLASLHVISEETIMRELEVRWQHSQNYTFVGDVLISLDKKRRELYGDEIHRKYSLKSRSDNAPHIFAVADSAYQNALHHMIPQRIVISGESGSGKTRNFLHLFDHFLYLGKNNNINLIRLRNAIKLIHALTHASTPTSHYSTRAVLKTNLKFGATGKITGVIFNSYLLEKWRISSVDMFQGNFHILYYVFDGLYDSKNLAKYYLNSDNHYRYLRLTHYEHSENCPKEDIERNIRKFKIILKTFEDFDFTNEEIETVLSILSSILIIGEIRIGESQDGNSVITNDEIIENLCKLLKIDPKKFTWALTNYCLIKNGTARRRHNSVDEARDARDVFANTLYVRLVDYIIAVINQKLAAGRTIFGEKYSIQIFDYPGFECFKRNHISQLWINIFNEQIHYHYLQRLFAWEALDLAEEEVDYRPIPYYDNKNTLDQLMSKPEGVLSLIDDASKQNHSGRHVIDLMQIQDPQKFVAICGNSEFSVAHYTGKVAYSVTEMPNKNRDFLPPEITETLRLSENQIIRGLFTKKLNKTGNLIIDSTNDDCRLKNLYKFSKNEEKISKNQYSQIRKMRTFIGIFKQTSLALLKELSIGSGSGGTHFVRCLRSDLKTDSESFHFELVKHQVRALAIVETAKLRQSGFPHRIPFSEFLRRYKFLAFDFDENVEINRDNCRLLLVRLKMEGWAIGKNKVFLKYYNEEYLARLYETQVKKIIRIQSILRGFLAKCRIVERIKENEQKTIDNMVKLGQKMTEAEAAAIIQKAYRESTVRKSYQDFAKDYKILDAETCEFIKPFAKKWRNGSVFHVLVQYRAARIQDIFSFTQQVHLYNLTIYHNLQLIREKIDLSNIDPNAQVSYWLGDQKPSVLKTPFHLEDIPFYDTSEMCNSLTNPGVSVDNKEDSWDSPYRWRELVSPEAAEQTKDCKKVEENLIHLPYTRNPEEDLKILPKDSREELIQEEQSNKVINNKTKFNKEQEYRDVKIRTDNKTKNDLSGIKLKPLEKKELEDFSINSNTKPANKDFDYIKPSSNNRQVGLKKIDPVAELRQIGGRKSSLGSEDDPPFNFQGMLRKTNYNRETLENKDAKVEIQTEIQGFSFRNKRPPTNVGNINGFSNNANQAVVSKQVAAEILPGMFIEGFEVEL